ATAGKRLGRGWGADETVFLGFEDDSRHRLDGFDRVLTDGGFGGEHDGVGAVPDGVGNVPGLGAGRHRLRNHRLPHLGGGDGRDAEVVGGGDDLFLGAGDLLRRQLHAEVAAGDHEGVGLTGDFPDVVEGVRSLDLGDETGGIGTVGGGDAAGEDEVAGVV